jgi:hypothetical protein
LAFIAGIAASISWNGRAVHQLADDEFEGVERRGVERRPHRLGRHVVVAQHDVNAAAGARGGEHRLGLLLGDRR